MELKVVMNFIAKNPPSIFILGGLLGWILGGLTGIKVFLDNWWWILMAGFFLQILWLFKDAIIKSAFP